MDAEEKRVVQDFIRSANMARRRGYDDYSIGDVFGGYGGGGYGGDTIGDLIGRGGDIAAQRALSSGSVWGQAIPSILGQIGSAVGQYGEYKQKEEEKKKMTVQAQAVNDAIDRGDVKALFKILPPDKAATIAKGLEAHGPDAAEKFKDPTDIFVAGAKLNRALPEGSREKGWQAQVANWTKLGILTPEQAQQYATYDPAVEEKIATLKDTHKENESPWGTPFTGPDQLSYQTNKTTGEVRRTPGVGVKPPEKKEGPAWGTPFTGPDGVSYQTNRDTGEVRKTPLVGAKPPESDKPLTDDEKKTAGFLKSAIPADERARAMEADPKADIEPGFWENLASGVIKESSLPEDRRKYIQTIRDFARAYLRPESGGSITPEELKQAAQTYFKQHNDTPDIVRQKQESRRQVIEGLQQRAGRAWSQQRSETTKEQYDRLPVGASYVKDGVTYVKG